MTLEQQEFVFTKPSLALLNPDQIYALADDQLLTILEEDRRIERKSAKMAGRALGDYFSMWANTAPDGGLIVIGIEKDGKVSGCISLSQGQVNDHEKAGLNFCPDARHRTRRVPITNQDGSQDYILLVRVFYRDDKVVKTVGDKAFLRVGDEKHELTPEEIKEMQIDKRELDLEREPVDLAWPADFDLNLVRSFCDRVREQWDLTSNHTSEQILTHRRLGKISSGVFIPDVACALVLARDPMARYPGCKIRILRYEGEVEKTGSNYNVVKDWTVEGNIPTLIVESAKILESQLRQFSRLGKDGKFYTAPEYPRSAWYEALVNACVHRSYGLKNRVIFIKMFDDRLVIESPGGFPPTVTPENIYDVHHPRNPNTMEALRYLDFVKCHNEGTRRMRDTMTELCLPLPEFEEKESSAGNYSVRVTLRNNVKQRKVWVDSALRSTIGENLLRTLTDEERIVMNFISENGAVNVSQCQRLLEFPRWHSAKALLMQMVKKRLLQYQKKSSAERSTAYFKLRKSLTT